MGHLHQTSQLFWINVCAPDHGVHQTSQLFWIVVVLASTNIFCTRRHSYSGSMMSRAPPQCARDVTAILDQSASPRSLCLHETSQLFWIDAFIATYKI